VRSPYAHAKITAIRTEKALAIPGVLAVITGETLKGFNLHWMPTLMSDTQMVLPVEKVMYQAQEVAAVIATDRYICADGGEAGGGGGAPPRSLRRGRRRRGGGGGLRAAAGGGRSQEGPGAGSDGPPHRQGGQEGQPHLALGGGGPRGDRQGFRRG